MAMREAGEVYVLWIMAVKGGAGRVAEVEDMRE